MVDTLRTAAKTKRPAMASGPGRLSILEKDQKILWARAAGRCAMPECRAILTLDPLEAAAATVGDMAHIVGYEPRSARSRSTLTARERNHYANLILLCRHHHGVVDADTKKFSVEVLHTLKVEHEDWVTESLGAGALDPDLLVHSNMVDTITTALKLDQWVWFVENAVIDLVHEDFLDARGNLNAMVLAALWPKKRQGLSDAIRSVVTAFDSYIANFETNAELRGDGFLGADKSYKRYQNPQYHVFAEKEDGWSRRNFALLCQFVNRLNVFGDTVRASLNPMYFRLAGRFLVVDSMGYRLGRGGVLHATDELVAAQLQATS